MAENPHCFRRSGFTLVETVLVLGLMVALLTIAFTVTKSMQRSANLAQATRKLSNLGTVFVDYTRESNGLLPYEDAPGDDDWMTAADPANSEVWYNALPRLMGLPGVGELAETPVAFYQEDYPIYIPGAPYPADDSKLSRPYFAVAMNSRQQRKGEDGVKTRGMLSSIMVPERTVAFLESGMPGDEKVNKAQTGFSGKPKANPQAFAARHNQKGVLVFVDGHTEVRLVSDLIDRGGMIKFPQDDVVWTLDPDENPN